MGNVEDKIARRNYRRHVRIWKLFSFLCPGIFCRLFRYSYIRAPKELKPPYIVLSNHNTDLDPVLVGLSFPLHMYIVASEHVYRRGFFSKILKWAFEPIAKMKGASDTLTVMKMIRYLRNGKNVLIFPEGNRSFNGVTCTINETIGKLVKTSGATMVTYKLSGGYLTTPRWGYGIRKGMMHGEIVNIYKSEQLKEMSPEQISELVRNDLSEDAFETQNIKKITYKGKNRAVGFECSYCTCPECNSFGTIASKGNRIFCTKCNMSTEFTDKGFFSEGFKFHTVYEWDVWQEEYFSKYVDSIKETNGFLFCDSDIFMKTVGVEHSEEDVGVGKLEMFKDRLVFTTNDKSIKKEVFISNLPDMSIYGKCGLLFTDVDGIHYELLRDTKGELYNARKYLSCWKILRKKVEN